MSVPNGNLRVIQRLPRIFSIWVTIFAVFLLGVFIVPPLFAQSPSLVTVNADKALVINGQKVFPIGMSPGPPIHSKTSSGSDSLQELRNAGVVLFRINQTNNWNSQVIVDQQAALDWAAQHNMYCWLNLRELSKFSATDTNTPVQLANMVNLFKDHPALGLWKNFDEAWWAGVSEPDLERGYDVIIQNDTNHPVVQTHAPRGTVADLQPYNAAADILALDIYPVAVPPPSNPPITNTSLSQLGDWTDVLSQVADGQKEFWMIEQIAFSGTTPPNKTLVFPTFTQSRYMAYEAIIDGARGLMFFGGNITATLNAQDAPLGWNWTFWNHVLRPVVQQLGDHSVLASALVAPNSTLPITMSGTTSPDIEFCVREVPPYLYILAGKREGSTTNVTFSGLPTWATNAEVLYESPRTITAVNGQFSDAFAPFDVHVYRFSQTNQNVTITFQPQNQTNYSGTAAFFSVTADGTGPLSYQWRKNQTNMVDGTNIFGATQPTLILTNVSAADIANYDVVVSGFGSITSTVATLLVTNEPPTILVAPQSRTNITGTIALLSVSATGTGTLSYQWRKDGTNLLDGGRISGTASNALSIINVSANDAANYDVVISGFGSVTSTPVATLTVNTDTNQPILYEPFNYTNVDSPVSSNTPANWSYGGSGTNDLKVASGNLVFSGLSPSIGNSITNGGVGLGVRRIFDSGVTNGTVYFSALFRMNDLGYGTWSGATSLAGALTAPDSSTFRLSVMIKSNSPAGYVFGVQKGGSGATTTLSTNEFHVSDTVFLVGKYDFTVSPNTVSLWINPDPTNFAKASPPSTGSLSASTGTDGFVIDRFNFRQNTAASFPTSVQWDEFRVGLSWKSVTPPEPATISNPILLGNGTFRFAYTNTSVLTYSVYMSTNLSTWTSVGTATQVSPGTYQFTDTNSAGLLRRFYELRSP